MGGALPEQLGHHCPNVNGRTWCMLSITWEDTIARTSRRVWSSQTSGRPQSSLRRKCASGGGQSAHTEIGR